MSGTSTSISLLATFYLFLKFPTFFLSSFIFLFIHLTIYLFVMEIRVNAYISIDFFIGELLYMAGLLAPLLQVIIICLLCELI